MEKRLNRRVGIFNLSMLILVLFSFTYLVIAAPSFNPSGTSSYLNEDASSFFQYNFTANVTYTDDDKPLNFSFTEIKSNLHLGHSSPGFFNWISINSVTGVMTINSSNDNETGQHNISVTVLNPVPEGQTSVFYFYVNATNDFPNFTDIDNGYNLSQNQLFLDFINASDEEKHYPLFFNISFLNGCDLAIWSNRSNCSLFTLVNVSNISAIMNFTPERNDVGIYYANISVRDYGENYTCASGYCSPNYSSNKTFFYSRIVLFNVFSSLVVNTSDCNNKWFNENQESTCFVNITTKGANSTLNISSVALLRNYGGSVSNVSWFYPLNNSNASNFSLSVYINVTPSKFEIGNWTINLSVFDLTFGENLIQQIYVYVNRTIIDKPEIESIANKVTSVSYLTTINFSVYDDDFFIPDKINSGGGFNESLSFQTVILNESNLSQRLNLTGFNVQILNMPVLGTNRTFAKIEFTPNSSESGNYTINLTVTDSEGYTNFTFFNLSIDSNSAPIWNNSFGSVFIIYENNLTYLNLSMNVSDPDMDAITFSYVLDVAFASFNLNSTTGVINFTPIDVDVGQHIVNVTASDGFLINSTLLNFTIYNINDSVFILKPIQSSDVINGSVDSKSNINATEDNVTRISIWVEDDDFKIPSGQRGFYNEVLTLNLTIQGPNSGIFTFVSNPAFPTSGSNRSKYEANFTPSKSDVGNYNITINFSDISGMSDVLVFNLTVFAVLHNPVLNSTSNQTSAVNRTVYYRFNATDTEDGGSLNNANANFSFSYNFLNGSDFIYNNKSIFNTTSGVLNITFNSSQTGFFRINITVNDTTGSEDYKDIYLFVYDSPIVNGPASNYVFNAVENITTNFSFNFNHSMKDNLTYKIYMSIGGDSLLRYNISSYGNGSNFTWEFSPNFTDETTTGNITVWAIVSNSNLNNYSDFNISRTWNLTVSHTNFPLVFSNNIGGGDFIVTGSSPVSITLSDYFSDIDAQDPKHNQSIEFVLTTLSSTVTVTKSVINWTNGSTPSATFSSSTSGEANYSIAAYEFNESNSSQIIKTVYGNNFSVNISVTTEVVTTPSSGGGTSVIPYSFKLIYPLEITLYNRSFFIPLQLKNTGKKEFERVNLSSSIMFKEKPFKGVGMSFDKSFFKLLKIGQIENVTLKIEFEEDIKSGTYNVIVYANSTRPVYSDWGVIVVNLKEINLTDVEKILVFTEELIVENPECIELKELVDEAWKLYHKGEYYNAQLKAEEIVDSCEESISQVSSAEYRDKGSKLPLYLAIGIAGSFLLGIIHYYLRRFLFLRKISKRAPPLTPAPFYYKSFTNSNV